MKRNDLSGGVREGTLRVNAKARVTDIEVGTAQAWEARLCERGEILEGPDLIYCMHRLCDAMQRNIQGRG